MPPKAKFSREEIVEAALEIVRAEGSGALTSRTLGAKLGSSARPVFTVFQSMEEVQQAVIDAAKTLYREYIRRGLSENPAFKGVGTQYILFAIKEPKLFQLLFMTEHKHVPDLSNVLPLIDENYEQILLSVRNGYGLDEACAERLYRHLWIYTHGIATLYATGMCRFTGEEISGMMTDVFIGLLKNMKAGNEND
ncbi:MAG: WHG domain-containing protein [Acetatifactor sp.]|nr:WHG domain-containing protein [Acetatifactor sp.]